MAKDFRSKLDRVLTHKIWGYVILPYYSSSFSIIFDWSKAPMDFIDSSFASLSSLANNSLPAGVLTNLISRV
jgi:ferrous iron transport protein B